MSVRFRKFAERLGHESAFEETKFQKCVEEEVAGKYKTYPRLLGLINKYWPEYKKHSRISHLILDHCDALFPVYLNTLCAFRKRGFKFEVPQTVAATPLDFEVYCTYTYTHHEVQAIEEALRKNNINKRVQDGLKIFFVYCFCSFGKVVESIFGKPFKIQVNEVQAKNLSNNQWEVNLKVSGGEL